MLTIYGIKNCNSMKKAFDVLNSLQMPYTFVDYKKQPPTLELLNAWLQNTSLDVLVNKKGTTYKKLNDTQKQDLENPQTALALLIEQPSIIKRPVITKNTNNQLALLIGFDEEKIRQFV